MKTVLKGELEVDHDRGLIYFHFTDGADVKKYELATPLRICGLTRPIPRFEGGNQLDITVKELTTTYPA